MNLRPFQKTGIDFLVDRKRAILGDDPGLGKTAQLLHAAQGRTLIVAPAMLQQVWRDEIIKWDIDCNAHEIYITSYSSLCRRAPNAKGHMTRVLPVPRLEFNDHWDTVICDEAHNLKSRGAKWTMAMKRIAKNCDRLYLATGTPVPNWAHEIYMLLLLLHPDDRRFTNYRKWLLYWFDTWAPPWGGLKIMGLKKGKTWERFATWNGLDVDFLRRTREEVLPDLPPLTEQILQVEMTPAQRTFYNKLKKDYIAQTESGATISTWSDGGLHTKLAQATTGVEVLDPTAPPGCKLLALRDLLDDRKHVPLVVFTAYRETARQVASMAMAEGRAVVQVHGGMTLPDRMNEIEQFKTGQADLLVGTLGTISEGLTLTQADTCIFVERSWRPSTNEQAMRRLHRIGQTRPVTVIHLETKDSIDAGMTKVLAKKDDQAIEMLTAAEFSRLL